MPRLPLKLGHPSFSVHEDGYPAPLRPISAFRTPSQVTFEVECPGIRLEPRNDTCAPQRSFEPIGHRTETTSSSLG